MSAQGENRRSFADMKERFKPVTVEARVCLDGELAIEIDHLEADLLVAQADDERLNREAEAPAIADRIVELTDELHAAEEVFVFQALSRRAWAELLDKHPPTPDDVEDGRDFGVGFPAAAIAACCVDPGLTVEEAEWLADHLSLGQFLRLQSAAIAANVTAGGLGKAPSSTARRLASVPSSTSVAPEASPSASSVAG